MKRYQNDFPYKIAGVDFETMENNKGTVCALDEDLRISYCNPAWVQFAKENGVENSAHPPGVRV